MLINKFNLIKIKMAPSHLYKKERMYAKNFSGVLLCLTTFLGLKIDPLLGSLYPALTSARFYSTKIIFKLIKNKNFI